MDLSERVTIDPQILGGRPVAKGAHVSVELVLELIESRWTEDQILSGYSMLGRHDVRACLAYARKLVIGEAPTAIPA